MHTLGWSHNGSASSFCPLTLQSAMWPALTNEMWAEVVIGLGLVLVSWGCCNKLLYVCSLKQQKCVLSQLWKQEAQIQGMGRVGSFLPAQRENVFHGFLWASGGCWQSLKFLGCVSITPFSASIIIWLFPCVSVSKFLLSCKNTSHWIRAPLIQYDFILIPLHVQQSLWAESSLWEPPSSDPQTMRRYDCCCSPLCFEVAY